MRVKLSSCGNPDFGQNPDRTCAGAETIIIPVGSFLEASAVCRSWIEANNLGGGNWAGGEILKDGILVGRVSYNGRVWDIQDKEIQV